MKILITGSTGLIGSALRSFLIQEKHRIFRMVRATAAGVDEIRWDPLQGTVDIRALEGLDAVIHLAGENIARGRWTAEKKRRIRNSRSVATRLLSQSLADLSKPPGVLISASAVGYYGDRQDEKLTEKSIPGKGFLSEVCREWENATEPAAKRGIRVVRLRIGMVLSAQGGSLGLMLPIFRMGLGGRIGGGRQYISWIAIDDLVGVIVHAIQCESLRGPVNAVSPHPTTNREFSKALGRALSKPAFFVLPSFAARILLGEMADEVLLASSRVLPARLSKSGYSFRFSELEHALRHVIFGKPNLGN
jgi:uncharacterized protein (TIGR01777 family)